MSGIMMSTIASYPKVSSGSFLLGTNLSNVLTTGITAPGTDDCTYELWYYMTSFNAGNNDNITLNCWINGNGTSSGPLITMYGVANGYFATGPVSQFNTGSFLPVLNTWTHLALTIAAGGGAGTNGQVLASTGIGVQWITNTASNLDSLTDVVISSPASDQVLKYNGSVWINAESDQAVASAVFAANAESDLGLVTDLVITLTEDLGSVTSVPAEYIYNMGSLVVDGIVSLSNLDQSVKADYISYAIIFGF